MSSFPRFDHIGITVVDLDAAIVFFEALGLEVEGRMPIEGAFLDTVIGMSGARTEIAMLKPPGGGTGIELSSFIRPAGASIPPPEQVTQPGLRSVALEVDDIEEAVAVAAGQGFGLVGGIGEYEGIWRMAYVRGPEGIIVALAQSMV